MELRGKIVCKAGNGKGFKVTGNDNWFNASDAVVPFLAKMSKGEEVVVTYEKKGVKQDVSKIVKAGGYAEKPAETKEAAPKPATASTSQKSYTKTYGGGEYSNAERQAAIQRGNALNAAAALLAGRPDEPEALAEMTLITADKFLDWLRAE